MVFRQAVLFNGSDAFGRWVTKSAALFWRRRLEASFDPHHIAAARPPVSKVKANFDHNRKPGRLSLWLLQLHPRKSPEKKRLRQLQEREREQEWEQNSTDMGDDATNKNCRWGLGKIDQTFVRIDAQMQEMEVRITERLEGRIGDEIQDCERHVGTLVRDNTITLWHELEEVVEDSVERSLDFGDNSWEDLKDEIRQACLDELKDDLEGGLVTITLPR
ncbi:hypothetical protein M406DRAFT_349723 [Cryphonectria parasitica EP155]|uniref:Uncharacterized protein n=1 Tax=Cryphonectria parasitica (strain ATCC 38755 / EP155) TaxID=660469 RepID=A0A9P5CRC2_CRYP1|nr:uncharacterized protein M406DRAFT_349723 [Cryphonectria parasitica EP155]KAF3768409.1 hypothetical protein M406DRAFT_349723 [Cryphonectria parasitica EP155]